MFQVFLPQFNASIVYNWVKNVIKLKFLVIQNYYPILTEYLSPMYFELLLTKKAIVHSTLTQDR